MKIILTAILMIMLIVKVYPQTKPELRSVWLTSVDSNVLYTDKNISDAMNYLSSIGINVVFPVVYNQGYTLYPSKIMDSLFNAPTIPDPNFQNRDFLKRLVIEAHRNGIEVIPWFEYGFATSYNQNGGHIIAKFPQWALKDTSGNLVNDNGFDWMSAINPDAQNFMISLMMEVLDNYDVDGVQGDDRLPAMPVEGGYDSVTVSIYKAEHNGQAPPKNYNDPAWMQWRANKLTQFLKRLRDSVKVRGNNMILSCAPAPYYWGYPQLLQDSKTWVQQGLADNMIPQLYQYNISDYNYALNQTWNDVGIYDSSIFTSGVLIKVGNYVVDTTLLRQMLIADRNKGVNNECYFFFEGLTANNGLIGNFLKNNFYQKPALLPYRNGTIWRPKAQIVNETDSSAILQGNWQTYLMQGYQGAILRTSDTLDYVSIKYNFNISSAAYYDVYTYRTPNTTWSNNALYTLYSNTDSTKITVDQSNLSEIGWYKIGTAYLTSGSHTVLKLDNTGLQSGRYLVTDAVMLMINRKLSPNVIITGIKKNLESQNTPSNFKLFQNYPNPFNPTTIISFTLAKSTHVQLLVFDLLGNEIKKLVDADKPAGNYNFTFDSKNLASGVYFYQLRTNDFISTKKMILLK